jgi:hypothetical protein
MSRMSEGKLAAVVVVVIILFWVVIGALSIRSNILDCEKLGEDIGRETQYRSESCYIEIAPDLFVMEEEVVYYLDHVEPIRGGE